MALPKNLRMPKELREYFAKEGKRGGATRAKNMTAEERSAAARRAVEARWAKLDKSLSKTEKILTDLERKNRRKKKAPRK